MLFQTAPQQVWAVSMFGVSGLAGWRGGWPERWVAAANVAAWLASPLVEDHANWLDPQWGILIVDLLFLAVLLWVALTSDRRWPMWASAFQLLAVVTHVAMMADRSVGGWAYITAGVMWSWLVLGSLAVGCWLHWRRSRPPDPVRA